MSFLQAEKRRQTEWKLTTGHISREARRPGLLGNRLYPFCLPVDHAEENLFADIRDGLLAYFHSRSITWHKAALPGHPSNHLCSSQVFLANFLGPFQHDREGMDLIAGHMIPDTIEVLPIEDRNQYIAFEWVPPVDLLLETERGVRRRKLSRGVGNTSIDFTFLIRDRAGRVVLVLGESKYTEHYPRGPVDPGLASKRLGRLQPFGESRPWIADVPVEDRRYLATEPIYQLLRHHAMALRFKERFPKIDDVRLVHLFVDRPHPGAHGVSPVLSGRPGMELLNESPISLRQVSAQSVFSAARNDLPARLAGWIDYMQERYRL